MLEETERAIKNGQSRNTGHTRHRTKTNKTLFKHNTESLTDKEHGLHQKPRVKISSDPALAPMYQNNIYAAPLLKTNGYIIPYCLSRCNVAFDFCVGIFFYFVFCNPIYNIL